MVVSVVGGGVGGLVEMHDVLSANIQYMHRIKSRVQREKKNKKRFRPHTVYVSLRGVKPSDWSCAAPGEYIDGLDSALFRCRGLCHGGWGGGEERKKKTQKKEKKNKTSISLNLEKKLYTH